MENETARCETLIGLTAHYSPSGQEGEAAAWLTARMLALGYTRAFIDAAGNAVGTLGSGPRQVILLGHIDTVPGELPAHVSAGILHGRGAVDAKGPLACFTDAVAQVGAIPGWQFVVIGAVEEERDSTGARFAAGQYAPEFAIIGEPNRWERIALGYKGTAWAEIHLQKAEAHSASPAETACEAAFGLWQQIQNFCVSFNANQPRAFDQLLPTLRGFTSGQEEFVQWAHLRIGVRLPPTFSPPQWYAQLTELCQNAQKDGLTAAATPQGAAIPAWNCEKNTKLVRAFLAGIRAQGGSPAFVYKTGTADLNIVAPAWGCPALVYGPGDSALDHTPQEQISLQEYLQGVEVLKAALEKLTQP
jgi:LysW-gamma-L-lysine carboxypeptidase